MATAKYLFLFCLLPLLVISAKKTEKPSTFVMGGNNAYAGQFPYAAAIYKTTSTGSYFCTGTLYNAQWIITAGNCVEDATSFVILLGTLRLGKPDEDSLRLSTDSYVLHPDYDGLTLQNNIGLIRLRFPVTFSTYLKPVDFLAMTVLIERMEVFTVGWGQIDDGEDTPLINDHLNFAKIFTISNNECKVVYGDQITDTMVCAEGNFNEGSCSGDVGGPLIQHISRGYSMIVGIANFVSNNGCGSLDPSGYTRVYDYADWIENATRNEG